MRPRIAIALAATAVLVAVGCGGSSDTTPVACLQGTGPYLRALRNAPAAVKLRGQVAISDCLVENQGGGELAGIGSAMVTAATKLNAEARAEPGGDANLQLGYLLGAAQLGAERTDGIHAELIRRLSTAIRYSPDNRPLPLAFIRAFTKGFDAGKARG